MMRTTTPFFSIIIALVIFFMYTKPLFVGIESIDAERGTYEQAIEKAEELSRQLTAKLTLKRSHDSADIERLDILVPAEIDEVKILADLNKLATDRNMLFGNVDVENDQAAGNSPNQSEEVEHSQKLAYGDIENTSITFSLIGTYEQFKSFVADLERSLVLMEITKIGFEAGEGDLQQFEVTISAFALPSFE
jgi:Tfp pilus assembly protein PilO